MSCAAPPLDIRRRTRAAVHLFLARAFQDEDHVLEIEGAETPPRRERRLTKDGAAMAERFVRNMCGGYAAGSRPLEQDPQSGLPAPLYRAPRFGVAAPGGEIPPKLRAAAMAVAEHAGADAWIGAVDPTRVLRHVREVCPPLGESEVQPLVLVANTGVIRDFLAGIGVGGAAVEQSITKLGSTTSAQIVWMDGPDAPPRVLLYTQGDMLPAAAGSYTPGDDACWPHNTPSDPVATHRFPLWPWQ